MKAFSSKRALVVAAVVAIVVAALATAGSGIGQAPPMLAPPGGAAIATLRVEAVEVAMRYGEAAPTDGRALSTTRRDLGRIFTSDVPFDDPVYAVVLQGRFTSTGPRPYGTDAPTGRVLTIAFDMSTLSVTDVVMTSGEPDLSPLGESVPLGP